MVQPKEIVSRQSNMEELWEYAINILPNITTFKDFAVAIMDFMGEVNIKVVVSLYERLHHTDLPFKVTLEDDYSVDEETLDRWYLEFCVEQEKKALEEEKKIKEDIDELMYRTATYRNSKKFHEMISYVGMMPYLAPYNAMLIDVQKPGTEIVFTIRQWRERYGRRPKINATPLIILVPFGPVQALYDYDSTEVIKSLERRNRTKNELIKEWCNTLNKTSGKIEKWIWNLLLMNLPIYGIAIDDSFRAASTYGGYLRKFYTKDEGRPNIDVCCECDRKEPKIEYFMTTKARFIISINEIQTPEAKFHTLCHELGHFFCRHLFYDEKKERHLSKKEEEFEAETVAWLVCKRYGVYNPSEEYLATYSQNGQVPICSLNMIMKAVTEIEKMIKGPMLAKEGLWYKYDNNFKKEVDTAREKNKLWNKLESFSF